jgi:arylsulfatase A-like enzyme
MADNFNLLFLFTDEQRYDTLAAYGNGHIQMPNLNRLAEESFVFDRAYVTQPICTPSRASLMTGLWPHTHGCTKNNIPLRAMTPCLPEMLPKGRYAAGYNGKWHLGDEIFAQHGFTEWCSTEDNYRRHYSPGTERTARSSYHHFLVSRGYRPARGEVFTRRETAGFGEEVSKPAFQAQEAVRFLHRRRREPFVLCVNFLEPHMPFTGPRDRQYDPASILLPDNFDRPPTDDQPRKARLRQQKYYEQGRGAPLKTEDDWRRLIARYWGLCSLVDTHVGTILSALHELDLDDKTIVVFTSDHGDMMGSHRLLAKGLMFEEAIRVPLLIRLPGQRSQHRVPGPVSQIDLVPTLLDYMGCPTPSHLQGRSLRGRMEGKTQPQEVFVEWTGGDEEIGRDRSRQLTAGGRSPEGAGSRGDEDPCYDAVRTILTVDGWKFNLSAGGENELYDLGADPGETTNLARQARQAARIEELARHIRSWQEATGDKVLPLPGERRSGE